MSENDMIAEYVKSKFPNILSTADFVLFKLGKTLRSVVQSSYEAYAEYENAIKECEEQQEAWKQQTMSRFERVE